MAVLAAPPVAVWMCAECGHGSPDPRDERAHLDAHRQLRAFFQEWDAGTEAGSTRGRRSRQRLVFLYTAVAALVVFLSVVLFSQVHDTPDTTRAGVPSTVASEPTVVAPVAPTPTVPAPRAAAPAPAPAPTRSQPSRPQPAPDAGIVPPAPSTPAPGPSVAPSPAPIPTVVPPTSHVLHVCLLGICLTVL